MTFTYWGGDGSFRESESLRLWTRDTHHLSSVFLLARSQDPFLPTRPERSSFGPQGWALELRDPRTGSGEKTIVESE